MNRKEIQPKSPKDLERAAKKEEILAWLKKKSPIIGATVAGVALSVVGFYFLYHYLKEKANGGLQKELEKESEDLVSGNSIKHVSGKLDKMGVLKLASEFARSLIALRNQKGGEEIIGELEEVSQALGSPPGGGIENHIVSASIGMGNQLEKPVNHSTPKT